MNATVYLETTVISYLTAWRSRDLVMAAQQQITEEWWNFCRAKYDLYVSQIVIREAGGGDPSAAKRRLEVLEDIPLLDVTQEVQHFALELLQKVPLPERAEADALHIALAVVHGMHYVLTWNCRHIANAALRPRIESVARMAGYQPPVICTPQELLEDEDDGTRRNR